MPPQRPSKDTRIPIVGYIRVSLAREEMISPTIQRSTITAWADRTNREVVKWVIDLDKTGRNFKREVMAAIGYIEDGTAREIGVYRYDRWGRNSVDSLANVKRVELAGGQVQSATEPLDVETAIGRYNRTNAFALAEMQSDIIGENWKATHSHRRRIGLPASGRERFGYHRLGRIRINNRNTRSDPNEPERYVPDYDSDQILGHVLADLYCQYVAGTTMHRLREGLNNAGILNAYGRIWSDQALTIVLDSGFGAGLLRTHDPECRCGKPSTCRRHRFLPGAHEPVIDMDLWNAYRKRRALVSATPARNLAPVYPLAGLVRCGHCHRPMAINSMKGRPGYTYRCTRQRDYKDCQGSRPRRAALEDAVLAALREWTDILDQLAENAEARVQVRAAAATDLAAAEKELAAADKALGELIKQRVANPDIPASVWDQTKDDLLRDRAEAEKRVERARAEMDEGPGGTSAGDLRPIALGLLEEWEVLPAEWRSRLLAKLIRHVKSYKTSSAPNKRSAPRIVVTPVWEPCDDPCCITTRVAQGELITGGE